MSKNYYLKSTYYKVLLNIDMVRHFNYNEAKTKSWGILKASDIYYLLEALVSNKESYIYSSTFFPSINNNVDKKELILSDNPFTFEDEGAIRTKKMYPVTNLTMKKTSSDTNVLDLEYSSGDILILYKYKTNIYIPSDDTEGDIFYYFTDDHNPIKDGKCIVISNSKTNGLSKSVKSLPSSYNRTDSFFDPHVNNLVYKSDLPTPINNIEDGDGYYSIQTAWGSFTSGDYSSAIGYDVITYGDYSHAEGQESSTSSRGFSVSSFNKDNKTYTLNSISNLKTGLVCCCLVGIQNNSSNPRCSYFSGEITNIDTNTNTITVSEFVEPYNMGTELNDYKYYLRIDGERYLGDYDLTELANCSHAEGHKTLTLGENSHTEGYHTEARGDNQHVQGKYNIPDQSSAHIIGNGSWMRKSNIHTLDWSGNAWFAGDVYIKSTSGTNKDSGSKKLATEEYVTNLVSDTGWITSTLTQSNGVCTYNALNAGGKLQIRKVGKIVYLNLALHLNLMPDTTQSDQYLLTLNEKYRPTQKIYFTTVITCNGDSQFNQLCTVTISPNGKVELPNYVEIARKQIEVGGSELYLNQLVSYPV